MEVPKVLPILRLSYLVIKEVLSIMDPQDFISIYKISLKFKKIAIVCSKQHPIFKYCLELVIDNKPMIEVKRTDKDFVYNIDLEDERPEKDLIDEFKEYAEYVMEVFGWPVTHIDYSLDDFPAQNKSIIDWFKLHVKSSDNCNLWGGKLAEEPLTYYLHNMEISKDLTIGVQVKDDFRLNLRQNIPCLEITN
ncbi:hypothetical protein GCK72_016733 [Caenorhabditis remanei]|uniref:F-box domain-containing protein n=1 Tax=Caenorhabditis remanei TaxID=31234 RepID=A0A6A5G5P5_CAERE|nr:hypothetical protein GCK72_016733 [Caenorhabditis remanei]KAF1750186.1 hypothetical protein GCK72_016733 [Caenorhabditis remanei]